MRSLITVIGKDKIGIIYEVTSVLKESNVNVLDITQTLLDGFFTMIMLVDLSKLTMDFSELKDNLDTLGSELNVSIRIQQEALFNSMHTI
ncbi:ACT domain-containing protein [Clostridium sp. C8-1-8]|uniref:ACT domain-containing protein n=1 Tax=Clostridium sp. C8-1-8 TaxID=2698831 RepID=UPI00137017C8|nr:ACT domain-containing protein [Clostridium sp. C8-1-8]